MRTTYKILIGLTVLVTSFLFWSRTPEVLAGQCMARINFQVQPNPVPDNGTLNMTGSVDMSQSVWEGPGPNAGFCTTGGTVVRAITIQFTSSGGFSGLLAPNQVINLEASRTTPYNFSATFRPATQNLGVGRSFIATAKVFTSDFRTQLTVSTPITVSVGASTFGTYACVAGNGRYACSPGVRRDCSDIPASANCQPNSCVQLPDSRCCNSNEPCNVATGQTHNECQNGACVVVAGPGTNACPTAGATCGGGGGGTTTGFNFSLRPPTGIKTFQDLVNVIGRWIFNLAIPIAVIMIIWAGVLMLTSGGKPEQFRKGMSALKYAVIGLAIVLIGKGFVSLIRSILDLRNP